MPDVELGAIRIGDRHSLVLIAGPCVIESEALVMRVAKELKVITDRVGMPFIFKSSYDKANRLSADSFRGPGLTKGLEVLRRVRETVGVPILTDIHAVEEAEPAAAVADILQIPAFLSRQTDLVIAAARTGRIVNVKKGQFLAPEDVGLILEKIAKTGHRRILVTERGTSFGYHNLVSDLRSLQVLRGFGYPVIYDATHSVQLPGGRGASSGGQREFVPGLARAAVAMGCDGLFMEVHPTPDEALSDGPNMLPLDRVEELLEHVREIHRILHPVGVGGVR